DELIGEEILEVIRQAEAKTIDLRSLTDLLDPDDATTPDA
ncbi:MAG: hypothetical protein QOI20_2184, partial [Acidimicrobiaceae bacterium]|nr:hypothetical protein [Acidimicrobiaceae bacterium]